MRVIYLKIRHARYLYIKRNVEKVWGARYTLGARYLSKNTVFIVNSSKLVIYVQKKLSFNHHIKIKIRLTVSDLSIAIHSALVVVDSKRSISYGNNYPTRCNTIQFI